MHLLFLHPYLPVASAPHGSAQLDSRLLQDLKEHVRLTLICGVRPRETALVEEARALCHRCLPVRRPFAEEMGVGERLAEGCHSLVGLVKRRWPLPVVKLGRQGFARAIRKVCREDPPDAVHVVQGGMAQYVSLLKGRRALLVDEDVVVPVGLAGRAWSRYRRATYPAFGRVLSLSLEDARRLERQVPGLQVGVRPVGLAVPKSVTRRPEGGRVLFFGSQSHAPNRDALAWLAQEIAPRLKRGFAQVQLLCAGRAAEDPRLRPLLFKSGIEVLGFVEDLNRELARAALVLSPVRQGHGVRIKNLMAMAAGAPLVTTPLGAEGIAGKPGEDLLVGRNAEELAAAAISLLKDPARALALGAAGRQAIQQGHSREKQLRITLKALHKLAGQPRS